MAAERRSRRGVRPDGVAGIELMRAHGGRREAPRLREKPVSAAKRDRLVTHAVPPATAEYSDNGVKEFPIGHVSTPLSEYEVWEYGGWRGEGLRHATCQ